MNRTPPVEAIGIAAALTLLALSIFFARLGRRTGPSRARRVLVPAVFFVLGMAIVFGAPLLALTPSSIMLRDVALALGWLVLGALLSVFVLDGVAVTLGAERTPGALGAGIAGAIILTYGWLAALTGDLLFRLEPIAAAPALVAAASAITWWPYLPRPEEDQEAEEGIDGIFD